MKRNIIPIVAVLALCFAAFSVVRTQPARVIRSRLPCLPLRGRFWRRSQASV